MNEEFTTQVDEACEDTSDRNQCDLREFHKRFCKTYRSHSVVIYMENFTNLEILYNRLYKVHTTKDDKLCHC